MRFLKFIIFISIFVPVVAFAVGISAFYSVNYVTDLQVKGGFITTAFDVGPAPAGICAKIWHGFFPGIAGECFLEYNTGYSLDPSPADYMISSKSIYTVTYGGGLQLGKLDGSTHLYGTAGVGGYYRHLSTTRNRIYGYEELKNTKTDIGIYSGFGFRKLFTKTFAFEINPVYSYVFRENDGLSYITVRIGGAYLF